MFLNLPANASHFVDLELFNIDSATVWVISLCVFTLWRHPWCMLYYHFESSRLFLIILWPFFFKSFSFLLYLVFSFLLLRLACCRPFPSSLTFLISLPCLSFHHASPFNCLCLGALACMLVRSPSSH